ncbi:hypothetical protein [Candidatus Methanocrinis natronophilus]|uniref:Uncharacterized protein n=1 Tax=Candidatus Methanocrinis natronophilus TaxID=3033396 RepID=A0ABT5XAP8_9EURY|nr:hypothetical protein [Candidatus Methanocrinis natronophilus]MDF0591795.1 hypothetical protein [Candidatus Methanocrinis natronophilus]
MAPTTGARLKKGRPAGFFPRGGPAFSSEDEGGTLPRGRAEISGTAGVPHLPDFDEDDVAGDPVEGDHRHLAAGGGGVEEELLMALRGRPEAVKPDVAALVEGVDVRRAVPREVDDEADPGAEGGDRPSSPTPRSSSPRGRGRWRGRSPRTAARRRRLPGIRPPPAAKPSADVIKRGIYGYGPTNIPSWWNLERGKVRPICPSTTA